MPRDTSGSETDFVLQEAKTNKIELHDDEPAVVDAMVQFFYKHEYDLPSPATSTVSPAIFHVQVHNLADKYDITALQEQATNKVKTIVYADWHDARFAELVKHVYSTGPSKSLLRAFLSELVADHAKELLITDDDLSQAFAAVAADVPELGMNVACCLARRIRSTAPVLYECSAPSCGITYGFNPAKFDNKSHRCLRCGTPASI